MISVDGLKETPNDPAVATQPNRGQGSIRKRYSIGTSSRVYEDWFSGL